MKRALFSLMLLLLATGCSSRRESIQQTESVRAENQSTLDVRKLMVDSLEYNIVLRADSALIINRHKDGKSFVVAIKNPVCSIVGSRVGRVQTTVKEKGESIVEETSEVALDVAETPDNPVKRTFGKVESAVATFAIIIVALAMLKLFLQSRKKH